MERSSPSRAAQRRQVEIDKVDQLGALEFPRSDRHSSISQPRAVGSRSRLSSCSTHRPATRDLPPELARPGPIRSLRRPSPVARCPLPVARCPLRLGPSSGSTVTRGEEQRGAQRLAVLAWSTEREQLVARRAKHRQGRRVALDAGLRRRSGRRAGANLAIEARAKAAREISQTSQWICTQSSGGFESQAMGPRTKRRVAVVAKADASARGNCTCKTHQALRPLLASEEVE